MGNLIGNVQDRIKSSTNVFALITFKILTGLFLGLTLALIGDKFIDYGLFSFVLVVVVVNGTLFKISRNWSWMNMLIFNLICVLIGLLLRMYILIAPG